MENKRELMKIRKLTAAELISLAFEVYGKQFRFLAAAGLAVYIPMSVFSAILPSPYAYISADTNGLMFISDMGGLLLSLLPMLALNAVFTPLFVSAATHIARRHTEDAPCGFPGLMEASLSKWGKLAATGILYYLITAVASFALIPAIFFAVACAFYPNLMSEGNSWGFRAFRDSMVFVRGRWFRTFGFFIIVYIASALVTSFVQAALLIFLPASGLGAFFASLASDFAAMYFTVITALWFLNRQYLGRV